MELDPIIKLAQFENEVLRQVKSDCPELKESNTQCYVIESENDKFLIKDNAVYAIFDEIYSPRRVGGGERRLFHVSPPTVLQVGAKQGSTSTFYQLTLARGTLVLALGNQQHMQFLRKTLDKLVSDEKIITIVKQSYKLGITAVRDSMKSKNKIKLQELFSQMQSFNWLPRAFPSDLQFSQLDELGD